MSCDPKFRFRLYVAGETQNSARARANLAAFCAAHLPHRHEIEIVNVLQEPRRAMADRVFMTPTVIKLAPAPDRRMIGTLSHTQLLREILGLEICPA